jgi:hemerythrin-like domain-containing protein
MQEDPIPTIDAIDLLQRDHDEIRRLLAALAQPSPSAVEPGTVEPGTVEPGTVEPGTVDTTLIAHLVIVESGHEAIEERYFWPLVRRRVQNGPRLADEAVSQEREIKRVLDLLERNPDPARLRQFLTLGRAHIDFEETEVWPGVRLALSEQELGDLGAQLEQGKRLAPTRPHPNMPCTPEVLKVAAPLAGAADRIRDALVGRNRD